ncbi:MAG TPA: molecular chaperone TorD family protein [Lacipirellula sp.]
MNMHTTEAALFDPAVNMARQSLYRFAALSLLDPRQGSWKNLRALREDRLLHESADFLRTLPEARPARLGVGELPLNNLDPGYVLARLPGSPELFNAEYESAFGLLVSCACPPHEIEYVPSKFDFQRSNGLADISGFYHAFGLTIADEHPERPDHIVLELEFMAFLLGLERRAAEFSDVERGQICREAQAMFLSEHLAWWAPAFARLLAREAADGFYAAVADFLAALIPAERALVGVEVPGRPAAPTQIERPEACEGCKIST